MQEGSWQMTLSRRNFIGSLSLMLASPALLRAEDPITRIGILSDPHVTVDSETVIPLRKAFHRFAIEGVRTVVIAGDVCHVGTLDELKRVMQVWDEEFPGGCNKAGHKVDPIFVWGNHDYHTVVNCGKDLEDPKKKLIFYNKDIAWRLVTGENVFPGEIYLKESNGVVFIGAHWGHQNELGEFLNRHKAEIPADKLVVYVQHPHPKGTCFRGWATYDDGANHNALMAHPNFFCISGHSHVSVSMDDAFWLGGFASMGTGSMRITSSRRYEYNAKVPKGKNEVRHMGQAPSGGAQQASILSVYSDRLVVTRHEYRYDEPLGEDWLVDFPFRHDKQNPCVIADAACPPEFPKGTVIDVKKTTGVVRPSGASERQVQFAFNAAVSNGPHSRVVDYRVVITKVETGDVVIERLVMQGMLGLSEKRTIRCAGFCAFGEAELPQGERLCVTITPINAGARSGRPITKEFVL